MATLGACRLLACCGKESALRSSLPGQASQAVSAKKLSYVFLSFWLTVFASILVECRKMLRLTVFHRQLSTVPASEFRRLGAYLLISGLLECAIR